jgi:hypothetical protein
VAAATEYLLVSLAIDLTVLEIRPLWARFTCVNGSNAFNNNFFQLSVHASWLLRRTKGKGLFCQGRARPASSMPLAWFLLQQRYSFIPLCIG